MLSALRRAAFAGLMVGLLGLTACESLPGLRPALTVVGITLLQQLEALLLEYEANGHEAAIDTSEILMFEAQQLTLHRQIEGLMLDAAEHVPEKTLQRYRERLAAVPRGAPRG